MSTEILFLLAVAAILVVIALVVVRSLSLLKRRLPYVARESVLTNAELAFYSVLVKATRTEHKVLCMVRMADVLTLPNGARDGQSHLNRIISKHVDFMVCDGMTFRPLVAVELDDASHSRPERMERDLFVNEAFQAAGLPLLRIRAARSYNQETLGDEIDKALQGSPDVDRLGKTRRLI